MQLVVSVAILASAGVFSNAHAASAVDLERVCDYGNTTRDWSLEASNDVPRDVPLAYGQTPPFLVMGQTYGLSTPFRSLTFEILGPVLDKPGAPPPDLTWFWFSGRNTAHFEPVSDTTNNFHNSGTVVLPDFPGWPPGTHDWYWIPTTESSHCPGSFYWVGATGDGYATTPFASRIWANV